MKTTTVSKLKASLDEYLRQVKTGEEVVVTERGRPIARLVPALSGEPLSEHLAKMEQQGLLTRGSGKLPEDFWDLPRPKDPSGLVMKAVLQEREEGR